MSSPKRKTNEFASVADVHEENGKWVSDDGRVFLPVPNIPYYGLLLEAIGLEHIGKVHNEAATRSVFTDIAENQFTGAAYAARNESLEISRNSMLLNPLPAGYVWLVEELVEDLNYPRDFEGPVNMMQVYGRSAYPEIGELTDERTLWLIESIVEDLEFDTPDISREPGQTYGIS